jgi:protein dithiol oxidoreductase (disulfide-forming)
MIKKLSLLITLFAAAAVNMQVTAAESRFVEGKDYEITAPKTQTEPLVEEFFNYACGACYGAETLVNNIKKNNPGIKFRAVPVELRAAWKIYVKAYFIGEKLNVLDKSHNKIFHRIHVEKKYFKGEDDMKDFFLSLGVDEKAYDDVANSYWINTQMRLAKQYTKKHKAFSTPTFLVNKRYKLNQKAMGSFERVEQAIVEFSGINDVKASQAETETQKTEVVNETSSAQ